MTMLGGLKPVFLEALRFADAKTRAALAEQWNKECQAIYEYKKQLIVEEHYKAAHNGSGWISVEERLPDKEGTYLTYTDKDKMLMDVFCIYPSHGTRFWAGGNGKVTHWMPLPEAPKGGAE